MSKTSTDDNRSRTPWRPSSSAARRNANGVATIRSDFERVPAKKSTVIFDRSTLTAYSDFTNVIDISMEDGLPVRRAFALHRGVVLVHAELLLQSFRVLRPVR